MFISGLVSISFRGESVFTLIDECKRCGLSAIELGSDIHAKPGDDLEIIRDYAFKSGVLPYSYGSYYRLSGNSVIDMQNIILGANKLQTKIIRIWAGNKASDNYSLKEIDDLALECGQFCDLAKKSNKIICLECHPNTLTDDYISSIKFLEKVKRDNLKIYFQPNQHKSFEYNVSAATALSPYVEVVHVFNWLKNEKFKLAQGEKEWLTYLEILNKQKEIGAFLEFMPDDKLSSLKEESLSLINLLKNF